MCVAALGGCCAGARVAHTADCRHRTGMENSTNSAFLADPFYPAEVCSAAEAAAARLPLSHLVASFEYLLTNDGTVSK